MNRWTSAAVLYVLGVVALGGCANKEADTQAIPVPTTTAATVAADPPPPPAAAGDADAGGDAASAAAPSTAAAPPAQAAGGEPTPTTKRAGESIDACCSALSAIGSSGKGALAKSQAASAAAVCPGIAKRVKAGDTTRSAGLAQIRSSFVGSTVPPECK